MSQPNSAPDSLPNDEEREQLRQAVRESLKRHWRGVDLDRDRIDEIWTAFGELGLPLLGAEPSEGGLREILVVMEELGAAACGAPFLGGAVFNLWRRRAGTPAAPSDRFALSSATLTPRQEPVMRDGAMALSAVRYALSMAAKSRRIYGS